jgi:phosphate:Na+ symporter
MLSKRIIPGEEAEKEAKRLKYLDTRIFESPPIAVAQIMKEVERMAILARKNVALAISAFFEKNEKTCNKVYEREEIINFLNREITHYLVEASGMELSEHDLKLVGGLFHVVNDIERIGDHAENIAEYSEWTMEHNVAFSDKARVELQEMNDKVLDMLDESIEILKDRDKARTASVAKKEDVIDELKATLRTKHIKRLNKNKCTPDSGIVFLDIVSNLERVGDHATNIAYSVLDD